MGQRALNRIQGLLGVAALFLFVLLFAAFARAEDEVVRLRLSPDTQTNGNTPYVKDGRTYSRDLTVPTVDGREVFTVSSNSAVVYYLYPAEAGTEEKVIGFPYGGAWTTVEVNGQLLGGDGTVDVPVGTPVSIRLASANKRTTLYLTFTRLPVLVVHYRGSDLYVNFGKGTMTVYDPDWRSNGASGMVYGSDITIRYRGQTSVNYEKHGYSVHLKADGEQNKMRLLGMRKDDDWNLDGMMNDQIRMRNTVSMALWREIYTLPWSYDQSGAIQSRFCELILNGRYAGLYGLNEKLDRKQADVDQTNGSIVRTVAMNVSGSNLKTFTTKGKKAPGSKPTWYNFEMKYPKEDAVTAASWQPFYKLLQTIHEADDATFAQQIGSLVDLDNLATYYVLMTAVGSTDNMLKNLVFVQRDSTDPDSRFLLLPWDVDGAYGRMNDGTKRDIRVNQVVTNALYQRLIRLDVEGFKQLLCDKWFQWRDNVLSAEHIMEVFQQNYDTLAASGVWDRETARWPKFKSITFRVETELNYIGDFMRQRFAFNDSYFTPENLK